MRSFPIILLLLSTQVSSQQLVDPTKPQDFVASAMPNSADDSGAKPAMVVTAIFIKDGSKVAVINGETVAEGQLWRGNKVTQIHDNGVVLDLRGQIQELFINQHSFKKDATNDF